MNATTEADAFLDALQGCGITTVSGVPCSYFSGPIQLLEQGHGPAYIPAVNEGSALAIAAGTRLAGGHGAVLAQNSGFGNLVNPLTSLVLPYGIPALVVMSMRGWPVAGAGEPQHRWMGSVVPHWLETLDIPYWMLTQDGEPFDALLAKAGLVLAEGRPAFILVGRGAIAGARPETEQMAPALEARAALPTRDDLVDAVLAEVRGEYVLSTTGFLSRSLFNCGDRARNFYMQGSMGHVSGLALGAALHRPDERFVVLDGDGAVLMHMGTLATIGHHAPPNLVHVVFDNGAYASTGGQRATPADFRALAEGCGYRYVDTNTRAEELRRQIRTALNAEGPALLVVKGSTAGSVGERASSSLSVTGVARRFMSELGAASKRGTT